MGQKILNIGRYYLFLIVIWELAYFLLIILQFGYRPTDGYITIVNIVNAGVVTGVVWGTMFRILRSYRNRIPSFALVLILSSLVNVVSAWTMIFGVSLFAQVVFEGGLSQIDLKEILKFYLDPNFLVVLLYTLIVSAIIDFVMDVNQKLGNGVLLNFVKGRYHKPREENRIFMFMDLKSSTFYAEQLGHLRYSRLIQDCFHDLTPVAVKNKAQIYQYVGDEVVLTWDIESGKCKRRCINTYFDYMDVLNTRSDYYRETYGIVPVFKAGVNCGKVTVAEVGDLKREIAYHGDAINTASRIQGLCNSFHKKFLVAEAVLNELGAFVFTGEFEFMGNVELKGKDRQVKIYSFDPLHVPV